MKFKDLHANMEIETGRHQVTELEILNFACQWPRLDPIKAKTGFSTGLVASGPHVLALAMSMLVPKVLQGSESLASPGIDYIKWPNPLRPGDVVRLHVHVLESRRSKSRPELGIVRWRWRLINQDGLTVLDTVVNSMFKLDLIVPDFNAQAILGSVLPCNPEISFEPENNAESDVILLQSLDENQVIDAGHWQVEERDVLEFARHWDPQWFHMDPAAASKGYFQGLIASGIHTFAIADRLMMDAVKPAVQTVTLSEINHLKWPRPVRPGDVLSLRVRVIAVDCSQSKLQQKGQVHWSWQLNNQDDQCVLSFDAVHLFQQEQELETFMP